MSNRRSPRLTKKMEDAEVARTLDSFQNFTAHVGRGTGNQGDGGQYGFNPVTRNRMQMELVYRGSWIAGRVVDVYAQDMTREGMDITSSDDPSKIAEFNKDIARLQIWKQLRDTIKWARLYGGAVAFMMVDGQDPSTPLKLDRIRPGQFKGLLPLDRWVLQPSLTDLVDDMGPYFGKPKFYDTITDTGGMPRLKIHYSRVIRIEGVELPYWQKISENLWGQSVIERMWDRLLAYDSATAGTSQMVYQARLRTLSIEGLREIIGGTAAAMKGLLANINMLRVMQSNEGISLIDSKDTFETHEYSFAGLDAVLMQFGEQLAGAVEIPLVKLFGQSPSGFDNGDSTMRTYHDSVKQQQVTWLGDGIETVYRLAYISKFGTEPPKDFTLEFKSLWQLSDAEKATVTNTVTAAVGEAFSAQIISKSTAMKELKNLSLITGVFSNISDEDIESAEALPEPTPEALGLVAPPAPKLLTGPGAAKPKALSAPKAGTKPHGAKEPKGKKSKDEDAFFLMFDDFALDKDQGRSARAKAERRDPKGSETGGRFAAGSPKNDKWTLNGTAFNRTGGVKFTKKNGDPGIKYPPGFKWIGGTAEEHKYLHTLNIPPSYVNIRINPDRLKSEKGKVAVGEDRKGLSQSVYLKGEREKTQDVEKFERVRAFHKVRPKVLKQASQDMANHDLPLETQDAAAVVYLMGVAGFRPGSDNDTKAAKKAYGVTTLEGRHVVVEGKALKFDFIGKKGVRQKHTVTDPQIVKLIRETEAAHKERIFDVSDDQVREYFAQVAPGFKPYDLRTWYGTANAIVEFNKLPVPKSEAQFKDNLKIVATAVSQVLGNLPAEALKSYIDPTVFKKWNDAKAGWVKKVKDWFASFTNDAEKSLEELMEEHTSEDHYPDYDVDWREATDPGDDDDGDEDDEFDIDQVIEQMYGGTFQANDKFDPAEKRDPDGKWTVGGKSEKLPFWHALKAKRPAGMGYAAWYTKKSSSAAVQGLKRELKTVPGLRAHMQGIKNAELAKEREEEAEAEAKEAASRERLRGKLNEVKTPANAATVVAKVRTMQRQEGYGASANAAKLFPAPPPKLTPELIDGLDKYMSAAETFNGFLRTGALKGKGTRADYKAQTEALDSALTQRPGAPVALTVVRCMPMKAIKGLKVGGLFKDKAYMSTSFSGSVVDEFDTFIRDAVRLQITIPKGFKFLSMPSFAKAMEAHEEADESREHCMHEAEALLPRGTTLKLIRIEQPEHRTVKPRRGNGGMGGMGSLAPRSDAPIYHCIAVSSSIQPGRKK
jgi:uncharacterized protein